MVLASSSGWISPLHGARAWVKGLNPSPLIGLDLPLNIVSSPVIATQKRFHRGKSEQARELNVKIYRRNRVNIHMVKIHLGFRAN
jgi:hypothetical protein